MPASSARPSGYEARPDYRVDLRRRLNHLTAKIDGRLLASSHHALLVDEQDHPLVAYFPREDVDMTALTPAPAPATHCPYKGDAHYYALVDSPAHAIAWSYAAPYQEVAAIADHIAFYQDVVEVRLGAAGSR